ncbi:alcohol dehydrogenase catalytic domain-containing protein [Paenibacillus dakarensis]|uniref:alcohol dehydrogenase catalytic domain-containing protein n=1 Tax=Paenibacillus dakarensis TaxID=1527293 RepID=UPI000AA712EE|nr:alcohol dehydrogenase catalytic domain-containing protein [Paenibacillus dakarensis]
MGSTTIGTVSSRTFRLLQPHVVEEQLIERVIPEGFVVVQPTMASICHADLRYYGGLRKQEVLARKLPMALLHEGIGVIVRGNEETLQEGQRVIIVPYLPGHALRAMPPEQCCPACRGDIEDNYCSDASFLGSNMDGIAQHRLVLPERYAIPIPAGIPDEVAVLAELCSVSYRALKKVSHRLSDSNVAVFGDGPVGYLTAAMLHHAFQVDRERLTVFGADQGKLEQFSFAKTEMVQNYDFTAGHTNEIVVECTGGNFSESAINQGIDILKPGGCLIAMGVSEERVPINTRDMLEKGITIYGSSRSSDSDFRAVLEVMAEPDCQLTLRRLLPDSYTVVSQAEDFAGAMESALAHKGWKKTILNFHW